MPTQTSTPVDRPKVPSRLPLPFPFAVASAALALALGASDPALAQVEFNADANCTGFVNLSDFSSVTSNLCAVRTVVPCGSPPCLNGDTFRDGLVDGFDVFAVFGCLNMSGIAGQCINGCTPPLTTAFQVLGMLAGGSYECVGRTRRVETQGATAYFQAPRPANEADIPPTPANVALNPDLEFDSYAAAGPAPVSAVSAPALSVYDGVSFGPSAMTGFWAHTNTGVLTQSAPGAFGCGTDAAFIGRFTVTRGERLRRCPIGVALQDPTGIHRFTLIIDGPAKTLTIDGVTTATPYAVRSVLAAQPTLASFGDADTYDLYVVAGAASGDVTGDCCASFADVTAVLTAFGTQAPLPCSLPGDANGDSQVSFADISAVLTNFGIGCAP